MHIVISVIKITLLISLGAMFLLGQGWFVVGPILHESLTTKSRDIPPLQEIPLILLSGLIVNYGILLLFQSLNISLFVGCSISILGLSCFSLYFFRYQLRQMLTFASISKWIGIFFICLLFLSPILTEPLQEWDARSIWFFHAKMIYFASSIGESAGWQLPSVAYSHVDYPNLVPALAAQVAYVMGFWNEYIPKTSLFIMLIPAVTWLFSFARRSFSFVILLLLVPFGFNKWIWNGYMDGYLALYFSIALLLLGRYINSSQPIDMVSSLGCFILLLYIKNEGALAVLAGLSTIILIYLLKEKSYSVKNVLLVNWRYFLAGLIALLPFVLWSLFKQHWSLSNDLGIGTTQSFSRIISRLTDGSYILIFQSFYTQIEGALLLLGLLFIVSYARIKSTPNESLPALIAAGIYCVGLIMAYLLLPSDLTWYLSTSISRTMLPVNGGIFIGSFYLLNAIENNEPHLLNWFRALQFNHRKATFLDTV